MPTAAWSSFEFTGAYAPMFWALLACNVVIPQAFWFASVRRNIVAVFVIAVLINVGMWLERILIIWNTLSHDYMPSTWRLFIPTIWDWITTFGSLGLFALMFLVFVRLVPVVSMHEVRKLVAEESRVMTGLLLAEFADAKRFVEAARRASGDAITGWSMRSRRFRSKDVPELLEHRRSHIRVAMFIGGVAMAALAYGIEYYSAVIDYPYNSGGRPFDCLAGLHAGAVRDRHPRRRRCRLRDVSGRDRTAAPARSAVCGRRFRAREPGPFRAGAGAAGCRRRAAADDRSSSRDCRRRRRSARSTP